MFCPKCKSEYIDGIFECVDCHFSLVDQLPEDSQNDSRQKIITVFATGNPGLMAIAKSILNGAGIPYFIKGEESQNLFGLGTLGLGYNVMLGPVEVQVRTGDQEVAKALLGELK